MINGMRLNHTQTIPAPPLVSGKKSVFHESSPDWSLVPKRLEAATDSFGKEFS